MRKNICEVIRRELDELTLDDTSSTAAIEHLRECGECREFQEKQTKLRQIVGSLGTVAAPADFDFRLRARLANESSSVVIHSGLFEWTFLRKSFAGTALLVVFATGAFLVGTVVNHRQQSDEEAKRRMAALQNEPQPKPAETVMPNTPETPKEEVLAGVSNKPPVHKNRTERPRHVAIRTQRHLATIDSASTRAEVINGADPQASSYAVPIDASSVEYFKVSIDDGRGNAKTISVPRISFGSQRLMPNTNPFAPKRVW